MLLIPKGTYTLTTKLTIKNSRVVLRGAGSGKTILYIPKSEAAGGVAHAHTGSKLGA